MKVGKKKQSGKEIINMMKLKKGESIKKIMKMKEDED